jgi:cytochrome c nitrite reductase small subunit
MQDAPSELKPSRRSISSMFSLAPLWSLLLLAGLVGGIVGLGGFTFSYAQGFSYLSNDPRACMNCHVMRDQFDGWNHGSHKAVATCNDCHVPHSSIVAKYAVKALNGFRHSYAFTTGNFEEPIRILPFDRNITQQACRSCHGDLVSGIAHDASEDPTDCLRCHAGVGHGR